MIMWLIANEPCHEHHFIYLFPTWFRETESQRIENVSVLYFIVSVQHSLHLLLGEKKYCIIHILRSLIVHSTYPLH
jgi:hypothetical protein